MFQILLFVLKKAAQTRSARFNSRSEISSISPACKFFNSKNSIAVRTSRNAGKPIAAHIRRTCRFLPSLRPAGPSIDSIRRGHPSIPAARIPPIWRGSRNGLSAKTPSPSPPTRRRSRVRTFGTRSISPGRPTSGMSWLKLTNSRIRPTSPITRTAASTARTSCSMCWTAWPGSAASPTSSME